jgi:hypothetical protein
VGARSSDGRMLPLRQSKRGARRRASLRLRHRVPLLDRELSLHDRRSGAAPVRRDIAPGNVQRFVGCGLVVVLDLSGYWWTFQQPRDSVTSAPRLVGAARLSEASSLDAGSPSSWGAGLDPGIVPPRREIVPRCVPARFRFPAPPPSSSRSLCRRLSVAAHRAAAQPSARAMSCSRPSSRAGSSSASANSRTR